MIASARPGDLVQTASGAWYATDVWLGDPGKVLRGWPVREPDRTFRIPVVAVVAKVKENDRMHTYKAKGGTVFHYNIDRSGDVLLGGSVVVEVDQTPRVDCNDIVEFVGMLVRSERQRKLEMQDEFDVLGLEERR